VSNASSAIGLRDADHIEYGNALMGAKREANCKVVRMAVRSA
jgi:hypothetical protein